MDRPWKREFIGFSFTNRKENPAIRIAPQALKRDKDRIRQLTLRWKGQSMEQTLDQLNAYARGWAGYFSLAETKSTFEELDEWVRRRPRAILWHQWKRPKARARNMIRLVHRRGRRGNGPTLEDGGVSPLAKNPGQRLLARPGSCESS